MEQPIMLKLLSLKRKTAMLIVFVIFLLVAFGIPGGRNLDASTINLINSFIFTAVGAFIIWVFWTILKRGKMEVFKKTSYQIDLSKNNKRRRRKIKSRKV